MLIKVFLLSILCVWSFWTTFNVVMKFIYYRPYYLYLVIGKKGSGKSTLAAHFARKKCKKGIPVYSNMHFKNLPVKPIGAMDIGFKTFPPGSWIIIDEAGLEFNCREWSTLPPEIKRFFVFQRKKKINVLLLSQSLDIDKSIRDKADRILLTRCRYGWLQVGRFIDRDIVLTKATDYCGSTYADELKYAPAIFPWSWFITFVPRYIKYFDTNDETLVESEKDYRSQAKKVRI